MRIDVAIGCGLTRAAQAWLQVLVDTAEHAEQALAVADQAATALAAGARQPCPWPAV